MPEEVVVGVGNPAMGDDRVGLAVVGALRDRPALDTNDVTVTHAGTTAFLALEALSGADRGVVVDAVSDGESAPGTIHRYRFRDGAFEGAVPRVLMHDFSFSEALRAGREAYAIPDEIVVIGVEPADTSVGLALSDPVADRVPAVVDAVLDELETVDDAVDQDESTDATPTTTATDTDRNAHR